MPNYTDGKSRNFDDLDIEGSNAEEFRGPQIRAKQSPEEKHLLKHCIVELDDGRHGYVFTYEEDERNVGSYFCHVCQSTLYGWTVVNQHISGKKHSTAMQKSYHPRINFTRIVEEETTVELQPGEPAPPGMEDMVEPKKCIIQSKLDLFKSKPLIGLEYLVELLVDGLDPNYYCLLCSKQGVNNNIIIHLSSHMHYLKYLQKYFSTVYSALMLVPKTSEYKKGYSIVLTKIIGRIETKYGRLKPRQCHSEAFHAGKKSELARVIEDEFHFRETIEDDYVNMVDWTEMKKLQFYNEDDEVVENNESNLNSNNFNLSTKGSNNLNPVNLNSDNKEGDNKSLFNKAGRINVDKRQLRKDRESPDDDKERDKSPDVIVVGVTKKADVKKVEVDRKSLSSISTISSRSRSRSRSRLRSRSRSRSRSKSLPGRYRTHVDSRRRRRRSRTRSPVNRRKLYGRYRRSRSRSRSAGGRYRYRSRSRSNSRSRNMRYKRGRSPPLPYPKRRRSASRSRSRSPRSRSPGIPRYLRDVGLKRRPIEKPREEDKSWKYKWEKFREEFRVFSSDLEDKKKYYEKNPEKHPQYPEEWKMFWNRRYKELQAEGKDPAKHDFKPEWIVFWNKRMKEIYDKELKTGKDKIKLKIGLHDDERKKYADNAIENMSVENNMPTENKKDVTVDDIKNTWRALTGSEIKEGTKSPKSPTSSVVDISEPFPEELYENRRKTHLLSRLPPPGARQGFIPFDDNAPRVISVLRTISVLESQIGSLGPKVLHLLSKALAMEKTSKGSSQDILCVEEHSVLFETVKEKLKGMLYAGLVDRNFVNMTKVALREIEDLFLFVPKVCKKEKQSYTAPAVTTPSVSVPPTPVTVPGVGAVDRMAIAQQIAGALIAQGKTDVSEEELEQLINAVVGMAQASSNSATPITTAQYIQQAQNMVSHDNAVASGGLKLLQAAYDDDENKVNADRNPDSLIETKPQLEKATSSLNISTRDLSDKDLKCLLDNFRELMPNEQTKLIAYFKKLESTNPERIASLQQNIDLKALLCPDASKVSNSDGRLSPFSARSGALNPPVEEKKTDDSDDDDYSVDDVYKAASEKLRQQELTQERKKIESMLAGLAEAVKKSDAVTNLTTSFQFAQDKPFDTTSELQHPIVRGSQSQSSSYQMSNTSSHNYSAHQYPQQSYQMPALDNRMKAESVYSYNMNPSHSNSFTADNRTSYVSGMDNRNQATNENRDFQFSNDNPLNRFPPMQSQFEQSNYNQGDPRNLMRY